MDVRAGVAAMLLAFAINGGAASAGDASSGFPASAGQDGIVVTTLAGSGEGDQDGIGGAAAFNAPLGIAVDAGGNVYVADRDNNRIRKITPAGIVTTLAGGTKGYSDGAGTQAQFSGPTGIGIDGRGNLYVADAGNHRIRKITPAGEVATVADDQASTGTGTRLSSPLGVVVDARGNVYVADRGLWRIRKITPDGVVTTLAGGAPSWTGEDIDALGTAAKFFGPSGLAADARGNIYVADHFCIRKVTPDGVVTTIAGNWNRDRNRAVEGSAVFGGVAVDARGTIYVADAGSHRIHKITPAGVVTTLAGSDVGDRDGTRTDAQFDAPWGVAIDRSGNLYIADTGNNRIRKITITGGGGKAHRQRP
jgi:sugar lactone lactonase YvrE